VLGRHRGRPSLDCRRKARDRPTGRQERGLARRSIRGDATARAAAGEVMARFTGESILSTHSRRPDVTDEDIGRRTVEIRRGRAVERAIELLRTRLGSQWPRLTTREVERLHWALGEVWGHVSRADWAAISFSALTFEDVRKLLDMAAELSTASYGSSKILDGMADLLKDAL
jgi:hypothetical protein